MLWTILLCTSFKKKELVQLIKSIKYNRSVRQLFSFLLLTRCCYIQVPFERLVRLFVCRVTYDIRSRTLQTGIFCIFNGESAHHVFAGSIHTHTHQLGDSTGRQNFAAILYCCTLFRSFRLQELKYIKEEKERKKDTKSAGYISSLIYTHREYNMIVYCIVYCIYMVVTFV